MFSALQTGTPSFPFCESLLVSTSVTRMDHGGKKEGRGGGGEGMKGRRRKLFTPPPSLCLVRHSMSYYKGEVTAQLFSSLGKRLFSEFFYD